MTTPTPPHAQMRLVNGHGDAKNNFRKPTAVHLSAAQIVDPLCDGNHLLVQAINLFNPRSRPTMAQSVAALPPTQTTPR